MLIIAAVVGLLITAAAVYVAGEFSVVGARRTRMAALAAEGNQRARLILGIIEDEVRRDRLISASQVGITASGLLLGAFGQAALAEPYVAPWLAARGGLGPAASATLAATIVLLALTAVQVVFAEIVPKAISLRHPERVLLALTWPLVASLRLLAPFITVFNSSANVLLRAFGFEGAASHAHLHAPEEIELLVTESGEAGALDDTERRMLRGAFDLEDLVARQLMVPRNRLELAEITDAPPDVLGRLVASPRDEIAVYEGTPDDVVGAARLMDVYRLAAGGVTDISAAVRPVPVVPETLPVTALWAMMVREGARLAVVLDEFGGTAGAVTWQDLVDEVLGEVLDEYDPRPEAVVPLGDGSSFVRGDVLVVDVNDALGLDLPTEGVDTMGGLVQEALGAVPVVGDAVAVTGVRLEVHAVEGLSVTRVRVEVPTGGDERGRTNP